MDLSKSRLTRRDILKLGAGGAGMFALTASGFAVPKSMSSGGGSVYLEAFPTSPLITKPFSDYLTIPQALRPTDPTKLPQGAPDKNTQDCLAAQGHRGDAAYQAKYGQTIGTHQIWPGEGPTAGYYKNTTPLVYHIKAQVAGHRFTSSQVQPIGSDGKDSVTPTGKSGLQSLPESCIYGFNGSFPGPMINAEYGRAALVRFENQLGNANGYDRQDFGAPNYAFLTHLHNGHTAPESDGQPHYSHWRFSPFNRFDHDAAWRPGEWVDQMYLGYPAGGDDREKQSFFWFHDHVHGHTGANVYKGMVGLMPLYDPIQDPGDETDPGPDPKRPAFRLPGRKRPNGDGSFNVDYDIPLALYDCRLDDGKTPHKDAHDAPELAGKMHPEWWGKTFFKHFPNHGFVGDIMTVNGTAFPVLKVSRRKYRLRFLDASISRIYNLQLMQKGPNGVVPARSMGYQADELQGQYRLPGATQIMKWTEVANEGGLLPHPIVRDSFELWPAKRREMVVDFGYHADGKPTTVGEEIYLCNTMKMTTGRMWDSQDPNYVIPLMKIVITADAPTASTDVDASLPSISKALQNLANPSNVAAVQALPLRPVPDLVPNAAALAKTSTIPSFELQRGSSPTDPETEWLINGQQFDPTHPLISPKKDSGAVWRIKNGGGGWVHPMHLHMEEHRIVTRNGQAAPDARHPDDIGKEDVVALDPSEDTVISRRFRTFTGPYVAHCHNLAHEDHNMMFGWEIIP